MFILYANKSRLSLRQRETVTSGSVNVNRVLFRFSSDWDGLSRTAIFRTGEESRSVTLDDSGECVIPWEVLQNPKKVLEAGVYGTQDGDIVLPTVWVNLGSILPGAELGGDTKPPTPDLWRQELDKKGDKLSYTTDGDIGLYSSDKLLSSVPVDHRLLIGRDDTDQHPVSAITGLEDAIASIPIPMTAEQLRKILMNGGQENA